MVLTQASKGEPPFPSTASPPSGCAFPPCSPSSVLCRAFAQFASGQCTLSIRGWRRCIKKQHQTQLIHPSTKTKHPSTKLLSTATSSGTCKKGFTHPPLLHNFSKTTCRTGDSLVLQGFEADGMTKALTKLYCPLMPVPALRGTCGAHFK